MIMSHRPSILKRPLRPNGNLANVENMEKEYEKEQVHGRPPHDIILKPGILWRKVDWARPGALCSLWHGGPPLSVCCLFCTQARIRSHATWQENTQERMRKVLYGDTSERQELQ